LLEYISSEQRAGPKRIIGSVRADKSTVAYFGGFWPDPSKFADINHLVDAAPQRLIQDDHNTLSAAAALWRATGGPTHPILVGQLHEERSDDQ
jgi:hypothetical protein